MSVSCINYKDIQVVLPQDIYIHFLRVINGIVFTRREIDIIACLLSGRTMKKIAVFLSISPKTVENHIRNVTLKLGCNSKSGIIDFIEKSEKFAIVKRYYSSLLLQAAFEVELKKITPLMNGIQRSLICETEEKNKTDFIEHLKTHLKLVGIKVTLKTKKQEQSQTPCLENYIFYSPELGYIDLAEQDNYYFLVLEILRKILPEISLDKYTLNFKKQYEILSDASSLEIGQVETVSKLNSRKTKKWIFAITAFCFICFCSWSMFLIYKSNTSLQSEKQLPGELLSFNLPRQDHQFIGREQLVQELYSKLHQPDIKSETTSLAISACAGLGGIGKTQLALYYAHHTKHPYTFKIWFPAENLEQLRQKYLEFAKSLGYPEKGLAIETAIPFVNHWLATHPGWLLVYDNVESYEAIAPFMPQKGGHIILTTRNRSWPEKFKMLTVDVMTEEDSLNLLKSLVNQNIKVQGKNEAKELVKLLGYLPLAIAQAGAYMQQTQTTVDNYLKLYKNYESDFLKGTPLPQDNTSSIARTWNISFNALIQDSDNQQEKSLEIELLRACSYLAPEKISRQLLLTWFQKAHPELPQAELVLNKLIAKLWKYSLINFDGVDYITVHRLVQTVLRHQYQENKQIKKEWYDVLLMAIHQEFNRKTQTIMDELRQENLLSHLQSLVTHYDLIWPNSNHSKLYLSEILDDLGAVFGRLAISKTAMLYYKRSLDLKEQYYGKNSLNITNTVTNLGMIYRTLGDAREGKELLERALKLKEQHYKNNPKELAVTQANLGLAYQDLGYSKAGKRLLEIALKSQEAHFGLEHVEVAKTLAILGYIEGFLGNYKAQKDHSERALKILEHHFGPEHPELTFALSNIGHAYQVLGDLKKGKEFLERCLKLREKFYGKEHQRVARCLAFLGDVYRELGDSLQAKEVLESSLKVKLMYYGANHPEIARTLLPLGRTYGDLGDFNQAKDLLERTLKINEDQYGMEHLEVARVLVFLGDIYRELGSLNLAETTLKRALKIEEAYLEKDHMETSVARRVLGNIYRDSEDFNQAKKYLEKALVIQENYYGKDHFKTAHTLFHLAQVSRDLKENEISYTLAQRAHKIFLESYGEDHKDTQKAFKILTVNK